ncbi:hypothetical protein [Eikenella halliae]|uniref:hypothetical protein n=1 Tax=Eikenella halliae TaxID=1795832 RepID=UPI0036199CB7
MSTEHHLRNNPYKVAVASMVGTAIEFYDYYIYAAAAVLVFNSQFFDKSDPKVATILSLSTLALAFFARPIGSALFGHRRQNRPQENAGGLIDDHGAFHRVHRPLAHL